MNQSRKIAVSTAEELIRSIDQPLRFLEFLIYAADLSHELIVKKLDEEETLCEGSPYFFHRIIKDIVIPMLEARSPEEQVNQVACGLEHIHDYGHYKAFKESLHLIIDAFAEFQESFEAFGGSLGHLNHVFQIGIALKDYEYALKQEKK